uniref:Dynactin subunit 3-like n=1 Tax=Gopherus evgoodei TaxID=1825980 RepID=A0A8C4WDW4_9SAUR
MAATAGLQERVEALERRVFGAGAARGPHKAADGLVKVEVALGNIAVKRERIKILYKKIEDLIKYLDPQYIDRMAVPDAMKLQFILAEEQFILSQVALLEQANNLQLFLDSAHIKAAPDHAAKLQRLAQIHIQQQAGRVYYKQQVQDNGTSDGLTSARRHQVPLLIQSKCRRRMNLAEQRGIAGTYHSFLLQTFQLLFHRSALSFKRGKP